MKGSVLSNYVNSGEELLSGQELCDVLLYIRKAIKEKDLSSQFSKYIDHLSEHIYEYKMPSKTRIVNTISISGGKKGMGWDEEDMKKKLKEYGITIEDVEYMVISLENELENPYSEFHKLACNTLPKEKFNDDTWDHIDHNGNEVYVFGCIHTEIPLNKKIWNMKYRDGRVINYQYHGGRVGISSKEGTKMPKNFYIRKVA